MKLLNKMLQQDHETLNRTFKYAKDFLNASKLISLYDENVARQRSRQLSIAECEKR